MDSVTRYSQIDKDAFWPRVQQYQWQSREVLAKPESKQERKEQLEFAIKLIEVVAGRWYDNAEAAGIYRSKLAGKAANYWVEAQCSEGMVGTLQLNGVLRELRLANLVGDQSPETTEACLEGAGELLEASIGMLEEQIDDINKLIQEPDRVLLGLQAVVETVVSGAEQGPETESAKEAWEGYRATLCKQAEQWESKHIKRREAVRAHKVWLDLLDTTRFVADKAGDCLEGILASLKEDPQEQTTGAQDTN